MCEVGKIKLAALFHELRHTHGGALPIKGVPMGVIAAPLGHPDRHMTERHDALLATNDRHRHDAEARDLATILSGQIAFYPNGQFTIGGPTVILPARIAMIASMVFHELAVNPGQVWPALRCVRRGRGLSSRFALPLTTEKKPYESDPRFRHVKPAPDVTAWDLVRTLPRT